MDDEEEQQAVYLISIEDSSDYWCGTYTELKLIYDKTFPLTSNGLKLKITTGTINDGIELGEIIEYKDTTCEEVGHKYNEPIKGNKNIFDIKIYEEFPEDGTTIASGMCGGSIFRRQSFLDSYNKINEFPLEELSKLDDRIIGWSDTLINCFLQYFGYSYEIWSGMDDMLYPNWKPKEDTIFLRGYKELY